MGGNVLENVFLEDPEISGKGSYCVGFEDERLMVLLQDRFR
jgi:hypothetical protein